MADIYISLSYNQYKRLEDQAIHFEKNESTHETTDRRFYHKAWRLDLGDGIVLEFQGPRVMAPPEANA